MVLEMLIFYFFYPCSLLLGIKKKVTRSVLLTKVETNYLKGMAAMMVVFAHYCVYLGKEDRLIWGIKPFQYLGPLGVAIFMFLSGYGLYISNKLNRLNICFLLKRLRSVYIPYLVVRMVFSFMNNEFSSFGECIGYFLGVVNPAWFIAVIMFMYIFYYLVSKLNLDEIKKIGILTCLIVTMSVVLYFQMGIERSYWFGNNLLFPLGVIVGKYESYIMDLYKKKWFSLFCIMVVGLGSTCIGYFVTEGLIQVAVKTTMGILLVLFILLLLEKIDVKNTAIVLLGNFSLNLYLTHSKLYVLMSEYFAMENMWMILLYFITVLVVPIVLKYMTDFVLTWLTGLIHDNTRNV